MARFSLAVIGIMALSTVFSAPGLAHAQTREDFAYGVIVDSTDPRSMARAREAGFTHAKMVTFWDRLEPKRGQFVWKQTEHNDYDNIMRAADNEDMPLVVRVDGVPGWAGGAPAKVSPDDVESFYYELADHGRNTVVGYEILNEPNLPFEWGGDPNPEAYAEFLKAAYRGIKAADPDALVLGGGPSPGTGGAGGTVEDVDFLRRMYAAGVKGSMDGLSIHNYGGNTEPERDPNTCVICFRRAELYRQVMVASGDSRTPIWATEYGWLMDSGTYLGQYDWMKVSAEDQASFVVRSYKYALDNWPWMQGMLLSNLDASTTPYHTGAEDGLPWFAILNQDYSPRPAWEAFKAMRDGQLTQVAKKKADQEAQRARTAQANTPTVQAAEQTATAPTAEASAPTSSSKLKVTGTGGDGLSVRTSPSTSATRLKTLAEGATVDAIGDERTAEGRAWRQIKDAAGVTGWAAATYLK